MVLASLNNDQNVIEECQRLKSDLEQLVKLTEGLFKQLNKNC